MHCRNTIDRHYLNQACTVLLQIAYEVPRFHGFFREKAFRQKLIIVEPAQLFPMFQMSAQRFQIEPGCQRPKRIALG